MRFQYVGALLSIPFARLHAHSHTLYFGWAGLAVISAANSIAGRRLRSTNAMAAALLASRPGSPTTSHSRDAVDPAAQPHTPTATATSRLSPPRASRSF
jgi:hypothetical protein